MEPMTRRQLLAGITMLAAVGVRPSAQKGPAVQVYKDATCGCCSLWVEHLRKAGFSATVTDAEDMAAIKTKYGVPNQAWSCHTAIVDGYVVEGHVPSADVQRLLKERPRAVGIAVPGMPIGSPGMEVANVKPQPYDVYRVRQGGSDHGVRFARPMNPSHVQRLPECWSLNGCQSTICKVT